MKSIVLFFACLLFTFLTVRADNISQLMQDGNTAYQEKKYSLAAVNYNKVISQGYESPGLYFNLGNAYFKMDSLPEAILYYEKARKINPGDEDILFNLRIANSKIVDKIDVLPELFYIRYWKEIRSSFSRDQWAVSSIIGLSLFLGFIGVYLLSRKQILRKFAFWFGLAGFVFVIFSLVFSWQSNANLENQREAVVFQDAVMVKSSPDSGSMDIFVVHAGTKVRIDDKVGDWLKISISNGSVGWVEALTLRMI
jgi:tetratricopeptide (TPR) repeat protein